VERIDRAAGRVYNLGGGPDKSLSVWAEFGPLLEAVTGRRVEPAFDDWRPGDQKVFVSDISRAADELGWRPRVAPDEGIRRLAAWVAGHRDLFG
jgi:CDP-paratose 2-epimerase